MIMTVESLNGQGIEDSAIHAARVSTDGQDLFLLISKADSQDLVAARPQAT